MAQSLKINLSLTKQDITKDWTFRDINVNLPNKNYDTTKKDIDAIRNSIKNMFMFNKGDRILLPEYGNALHHILYQPINGFTLQRLNIEIRNMFSNWEPRVSIVDIAITPYADENTYHVKITYLIPELLDSELNFSTTLGR